MGMRDVGALSRDGCPTIHLNDNQRYSITKFNVHVLSYLDIVKDCALTYNPRMVIICGLYV